MIATQNADGGTPMVAGVIRDTTPRMGTSSKFGAAVCFYVELKRINNHGKENV